MKPVLVLCLFLLTGVDAPLLAPQRLAVQQPGAGHHDRDPYTFEAFERVAVQGLGLVAVAHLGLGHRQDGERPVVPQRLRDARQSPDGVLGQRSLADAYRRLDEFEERARGVAQLVGVGQLTPSRGQRLVVAAQPVVEDGLGEVGGAERVALATGLAVGPHLRRQMCHLVGLPAVRGEEHPPVRRQRVARDVLDGVDLVAGGLGLVEVAVDRLRQHLQAERDRQHGEHALGPGERDLALGERAQRVGIPQVLRGAGGEPHPVQLEEVRRMVEEGSAAEVLRRPRHPYTLALLRAVPTREGTIDDLQAIDWKEGKVYWTFQPKKLAQPFFPAGFRVQRRSGRRFRGVRLFAGRR